MFHIRKGLYRTDRRRTRGMAMTNRQGTNETHCGEPPAGGDVDTKTAEHLWSFPPIGFFKPAQEEMCRECMRVAGVDPEALRSAQEHKEADQRTANVEANLERAKAYGLR
jgi:hypothetical protein